jgi:hypothetical protein
VAGTTAFPPLRFFVQVLQYKRKTGKHVKGDPRIVKIEKIGATEYRDFALKPNVEWMEDHQKRVLKAKNFQWVQDKCHCPPSRGFSLSSGHKRHPSLEMASQFT